MHIHKTQIRSLFLLMQGGDYKVAAIDSFEYLKMNCTWYQTSFYIPCRTSTMPYTYNIYSCLFFGKFNLKFKIERYLRIPKR